MAKDYSTKIGSNQPAGTLQFTLFIPSCDRDGSDINQVEWFHAALEIFGRLFRGATAFPPGRGVWRDDERGGELIWDDPVMVVCYADPTKVTDERLNNLRNFLHRMGRETRQGEVGLVIDNTYYGISEYDTMEE